MSIPKGTHCIITDPSSQKSPVILAETYQADRSLYHGQRSRCARGHTISLTTRRAHSTTIKLANASGGTLRSCPTNTTHAGAQGRATGRSGRFALRTHGTHARDGARTHAPYGRSYLTLHAAGIRQQRENAGELIRSPRDARTGTRVCAHGTQTGARFARTYAHRHTLASLAISHSKFQL